MQYTDKGSDDGMGNKVQYATNAEDDGNNNMHNLLIKMMLPMLLLLHYIIPCLCLYSTLFLPMLLSLLLSCMLHVVSIPLALSSYIFLHFNENVFTGFSVYTPY